MFSGKSSKEQNPDGSSVETREENAAIKGKLLDVICVEWLMC